MIGFLVRGRVRIKIRIRVRVRVEVTFSVRFYRRSICRRSKCRKFARVPDIIHTKKVDMITLTFLGSKHILVLNIELTLHMS